MLKNHMAGIKILNILQIVLNEFPKAYEKLKYKL